MDGKHVHGLLQQFLVNRYLNGDVRELLVDLGVRLSSPFFPWPSRPAISAYGATSGPRNGGDPWSRSVGQDTE